MKTLEEKIEQDDQEIRNIFYQMKENVDYILSDKAITYINKIYVSKGYSEIRQDLYKFKRMGQDLYVNSHVININDTYLALGTFAFAAFAAFACGEIREQKLDSKSIREICEARVSKYTEIEEEKDYLEIK